MATACASGFLCFSGCMAFTQRREHALQCGFPALSGLVLTVKPIRFLCHDHHFQRRPSALNL
jgi:hypothetical protein